MHNNTCKTDEEIHISFEIPGHPVAKSRPRVTWHGTYTPPETVAYKRTIQIYAIQAMAGRLPLSKEVAVRLGIAVFRNKKTTVRPDLDNYEKAIMDALGRDRHYPEGIIWKDDAQVIEIHSGKYISSAELERIEIEIDSI